MELSALLTFGVGRVASAALIGRLPGIAVFGAGLIAGALVAALAGRLAVRSDEVHAGAAPALAMSAGERAAPWSPRLLPGEAARSSARDAPQCGQAGSIAGKTEGGGRGGRDQHEPCQAPSLRIGILGSLTVNGQAGALVPAQSQLIVALALHRNGLSNTRLRSLLGADAGHPKPADSLRQLIAQTLTAAGIASVDAGPLAAALDLVRGQPFTGCYYWWLEPALVESVTARTVASAETLAQLRLAGGDPAAAVRAARIGLGADASAEQLWRIMMRAEHAAGNLAGVRGAWCRCLDVVSEVAADGQPDSATSAVYSELLAR